MDLGGAWVVVVVVCADAVLSERRRGRGRKPVAPSGTALANVQGRGTRRERTARACWLSRVPESFGLGARSTARRALAGSC